VLVPASFAEELLVDDEHADRDIIEHMTRSERAFFANKNSNIERINHAKPRGVECHFLRALGSVP
jgi:hypothetical protein